MKKGFYLIVSIIVTASFLSGCAQMRDKFIRKPKEEDTARRFYAVREYDVKPSMELYTKRYIFWKTWHRELLDVLDSDNKKKYRVAAEQELSNMFDMYGMLTDEKGDELMQYINEMADIEKTLRTEGVTRGNEVQIRRRLENMGKQVKADFSYRVVQGMIRDDFRPESQDEADPEDAK